MGIAKSAFRLLLEEAKKGRFQDKKILQLGRQHTFLTIEDAIKWTEKASFPYSLPIDMGLSFNDNLKSKNYINDLTLFSLLGFKEVHSLDVSSYENATLIHDLNNPIPFELYHQYDVIFDGGTLEHIFNTPQVFENIHNLLKENGIIIHSSPSHNHVDHGFYMFSPTLFMDYYSVNKYEILTSYIFEYGLENNASWKVFAYSQGCLDVLSFGGFGKKMLGIWFIAQKQFQSTSGIIPQQTGGGRGNTLHSIKQPSSFRNWLKKSKLLCYFVTSGRKKIIQFKAKHLKLKKIGSI